MKALKLLKSSYYLLCLLAAELVLAMTPLIAIASSATVFARDGVDGCVIGCFYPNGESFEEDVTVNRR